MEENLSIVYYCINNFHVVQHQMPSKHLISESYTMYTQFNKSCDMSIIKQGCDFENFTAGYRSRASERKPHFNLNYDSDMAHRAEHWFRWHILDAVGAAAHQPAICTALNRVDLNCILRFSWVRKLLSRMRWMVLQFWEPGIWYQWETNCVEGAGSPIEKWPVQAADQRRSGANGIQGHTT